MLLCRMDEVGGMNNEERFYDDVTICFGSAALLSSAHHQHFAYSSYLTLRAIKMAHEGLHA